MNRPHGSAAPVPALALRVMTMLLGLLAATAADAQQYKVFKDWAVGCDNQRSCAALGLPARDAGDAAAFFRVSRDGPVESAPSVQLVYASENPMDGVALQLQLDGRPVTGISAEPWPAKGDGYTVRSTLAGPESLAFIEALRNAKTASLQLFEKAKPGGEPREISLAGSAAALLFVDAVQRRDGGVTALVAKGPAPASAVPPAPPGPTLTSLHIQELDQPLPKPPTGVMQAKDSSCQDNQQLALGLEGDATLWGVCDSAGAYNFSFRMYLARNGAAQLQRFDLPGGQGGLPEAVLINPGVMEDQRTLNSFNKGRGLGDCGDSSDWVWDGTSFRLLRFSMLTECRGVPSDDWPQIYVAHRQ